jgi:hypothetical protein
MPRKKRIQTYIKDATEMNSINEWVASKADDDIGLAIAISATEEILMSGTQHHQVFQCIARHPKDMMSWRPQPYSFAGRG